MAKRYFLFQLYYQYSFLLKILYLLSVNMLWKLGSGGLENCLAFKIGPPRSDQKYFQIILICRGSSLGQSCCSIVSSMVVLGQKITVIKGSNFFAHEARTVSQTLIVFFYLYKYFIKLCTNLSPIYDINLNFNLFRCSEFVR